jgi:hypothetical protein
MITSRRIIWVGRGDKGNAYRVLVGKPEANRPLRRISDVDRTIILK